MSFPAPFNCLSILLTAGETSPDGDGISLPCSWSELNSTFVVSALISSLNQAVTDVCC